MLCPRVNSERTGKTHLYCNPLITKACFIAYEEQDFQFQHHDSLQAFKSSFAVSDKDIFLWSTDNLLPQNKAIQITHSTLKLRNMH
jgi:hypothetical protein